MRHLGAFLGIALALVLAATPALAQEGRFVDVKVRLLCGEAQSVGGFVYPTITIGGHENRMPSQEQSFHMALGAQDFKLSISNVYADRDPKTIIREIAVVDASGGNRTVIATPNSREASFSHTIPGPHNASDEFGFDIKVDECAGKTKIRIATTASCNGRDGEDFVVQPKVAVMIGGQQFVSNDNGVIEAEVPMGKYEIMASWFDASLSYGKQDGLTLPKTEDGKPTVTLSKETETLELRLATCDLSGATKTRATITELGGAAKFAQGKKGGRAVAVGQPLVDGDVVVINGTAVVTWIDGHVVRFNDPRGSAIVHIGPDKPVPQGSEPKPGVSKVYLLRGFLRFLNPTIKNEEIWNIETSSDAAVAKDKGTDFTFSHDDTTGVSTIVVTEGLVEVTPVNPALAPFNLGAGEQAAVSLTTVGEVTSSEERKLRLPLPPT